MLGSKLSQRLPCLNAHADDCTCSVYGYYHFSGAKKAVDSARQVSETAKQLKDKAAQATPSPKAILGFVRSAAHSYAGAFPGGSSLVDSTVS